MKIAICISGLFRMYEKTFSSLFEHILNVYDCDIFISTWNLNDKILNSIENLYEPKKIKQENFLNFNLDKFRSRAEQHRNLHGVFSMYYKIKSCNDLKSEFEIENNFTYDCVVRCRSDLRFLSKVDIPYDRNNSLIWLPNHGDYLGLNDQFALGTSQAMNKYSEVYSNIENLYNQKSLFVPEMLLHKHFNVSQLSIGRINMDYEILRDNGHVLNNRHVEPHIMRDRGYINYISRLQSEAYKK